MAETYGTVAGATTYHSERGNAAWAAAEDSPDDAREAALVRASLYIDNVYRLRFPGTKTDGRDQEREWPRTDAEDVAGEEIADDEIPDEVIFATYEAALREVVEPGSLTPDYVASSRVVREKVDVIETQYSDRNRGYEDVRPLVTIIDEILSGLIGPRSSGVVFLKRA